MSCTMTFDGDQIRWGSTKKCIVKLDIKAALPDCFDQIKSGTLNF